METLVAWLSSTATVLTCAFLVGELKRTRGFSPSSKRAKLDDETTSSSHPVAPESVPETETSEASSANYACIILADNKKDTKSFFLTARIH